MDGLHAGGGPAEPFLHPAGALRPARLGLGPLRHPGDDVDVGTARGSALGPARPLAPRALGLDPGGARDRRRGAGRREGRPARPDPARRLPRGRRMGLPGPVLRVTAMKRTERIALALVLALPT